MDALLIRRMMMEAGGTPPPPYDAEVEYLQGDGTAYINTGIASKGSTIIKVSLVDYFVAANKGRWPFGGRRASNSNMFGFYINSSNSQLYFAYGGQAIGLPSYTQFPASCEVELGGGIIKIGENSYTHSIQQFTSNYNVYLFALNNGGTTLPFAVKIGRTYISDGTTSKDLIPVRKNGVGYMYDTISGTLIGNSAASGAFTYGPDV